MAADVGILDQVTQEFLQALQQDAGVIEQAAHQLFFYLVVIQLSLSALWMTLAGESLQRFAIKFVQLFFIFGFFYGLMSHGGVWIPEILNGFIHIGQQTGVHSLDPSSIIQQGVSIAGGIFHAFFNWGLLGHPFVSIVGAMVCVSVLIIYGLIAAELVMVLVKAYIVVATSSVFLAFGGSDFTRTMATRFISAIIGVGLQLMTLYALLGVGQHVGASWAAMTAKAAAHHELMPMLVILAAVIVYYLLLKNIPSFMAGLSGVGGFRHYGDAAVATAMNASANTANALLRAKQLSGSAIHGSAQGLMGVAQLARHGAHVAQQTPGSVLNKAAQGVQSAVSVLGSASANTLKDAVCRQMKHTVGKTWNAHATNKIKSSQGPSHD